jgi:hypothetical protein
VNTAGEAISLGIIPCETNPETGKLARTGDPFHGAAEVTIGQRPTSQARRVCGACLAKHHRHTRVIARRVKFPHTN